MCKLVVECVLVYISVREDVVVRHGVVTVAEAVWHLSLTCGMYICSSCQMSSPSGR